MEKHIFVRALSLSIISLIFGFTMNMFDKSDLLHIQNMEPDIALAYFTEGMNEGILYYQIISLFFFAAIFSLYEFLSYLMIKVIAKYNRKSV